MKKVLIVFGTRPEAIKMVPLVKEFEKIGILIEITGYERNKLFAFDKYLSIYSQS